MIAGKRTSGGVAGISRGTKCSWPAISSSSTIPASGHRACPSRTSRTSRTGLINPDIGSDDDGRPPRHLSVNLCAEFLRRGTDRLHELARQLLAHRGPFYYFGHIPADLSDDLLWRRTGSD